MILFNYMKIMCIPPQWSTKYVRTTTLSHPICQTKALASSATYLTCKYEGHQQGKVILHHKTNEGEVNEGLD